MPTIAAMYLRKSRKEEDEPLEETLRKHHEALTEFASKNNITIPPDGIYEEVVSGDSLSARAKMLKLLTELDKYEAVLCMDIDRLGRGAMKDQGTIFEAFKNHNVLIITPGKTYDLANDLDDSMVAFKALFGREELKMIKSRLIRGKLKTIQEGCYVANAPFGYVNIRKNKKPTLEIVPEEAVAVQLIFESYLEGSGCQAIADKLNALGYKPHRVSKFSRTSVGQILRNPTYIGKIAWNRHSYKQAKTIGGARTRTQNPEAEWLLFDGLHEAIIDEQTFNKANLILAGRYHPPYRKPDEIKNPLSGILICSKCGRNMTRIPLMGKKYQNPIIGCPTASCQMSSRQDIVEGLVFTLLRSVSAQLKASEPQINPFTVDSSTIRKNVTSELATLRSQFDRLQDLLEQGIYSAEDYLERKEKLTERIKASERELRELDKPQLSVAEIAEKLDNVLDSYWQGTPIQQNALLKSVVCKIEYSKPKGSAWTTPPELTLTEWAKA
ncbi:MAG: recombinase family protein [Oscillospiraceae bacterium]|jgi:DNA invertase Pin-like site-specific DNA recombinase|nr:recombinase family protein [Oscillospiraceae bacterium]